jgi:hypothetical protein
MISTRRLKLGLRQPQGAFTRPILKCILLRIFAIIVANYALTLRFIIFKCENVFQNLTCTCTLVECSNLGVWVNQNNYAWKKKKSVKHPSLLCQGVN